MTHCMLCENACVSDIIQLRGGASVCAKCVSSREAKLDLVGSEIDNCRRAKPPWTIWDSLRVAVIPVSIFLCIIGALYVHFVIAVALASAGLWLIGVTAERSGKAQELYKESMRTKIARLDSLRDEIISELSPVYELYRNKPPDWESRRIDVMFRDGEVCQKCGRRMSGRIPFHVHHIIPASKEEGNHRLSNLTLLCETCHSKIKEPGHQLIKGLRRKRLELKGIIEK